MTTGMPTPHPPMPACSLIVHADDFGLSEKVNAGILDAYCNGILTSTSVIASGSAVNQAIELSRSEPGLDVGVHLTLVGEQPILPADAIPSITNQQGRLLDTAGAFMKRLVRGSVSLDEVRREFDAQISRVADHGVEISHLDGHQHLHMAPGIRSIVGELARKWRVPAIRYPAENLRPYMLNEPGAWRRVAELLLLNAFCSFAPTDEFARPDHFFGFYFGGRLSKRNLLTLLAHLPPRGTCELMCHPGLSDPASPYRHWNYWWQEEHDALLDPKVSEFLRKRGVELITYRDLRAAAH